MIRRLLCSIMLLCLCFIATPTTALAFDPFGGPSGINCSDSTNKTSAVCQDKTSSDPISGSNGLLYDITQIVAYIAGAAAVILIIISGLRYITSGGDSNAVGTAKSTLTGAIIGLLVIALASSLITYVVNKL
ncbi:MAG TPA: pilin [Candidatus Saccharimonadales bacterium]|nr:pilin [Candidatus Saccharimonadales bacterium]